MYEDQIGAQRRALKAVLKAAEAQAVDIDALCNAATELLESDPSYGSDQVTEAIEIIKRMHEFLNAPGSD